MALVFTSLSLKNIAYVRPRIWLVGCWRGRASPRWASLGQAGPQWAPDEPLTSFSLMCKRPDLWICYYFPCQIFSMTVPEMSKITNQWRICETLTSNMKCWCNCSISIANSATGKAISISILSAVMLISWKTAHRHSSERVFGQRPRQGTKSCRMGRNSVHMSVCRSVRASIPLP